MTPEMQSCVARFFGNGDETVGQIFVTAVRALLVNRDDNSDVFVNDFQHRLTDLEKHIQNKRLLKRLAKIVGKLLYFRTIAMIPRACLVHFFDLTCLTMIKDYHAEFQRKHTEYENFLDYLSIVNDYPEEHKIAVRSCLLELTQHDDRIDPPAEQTLEALIEVNCCRGRFKTLVAVLSTYDGLIREIPQPNGSFILALQDNEWEAFVSYVRTLRSLHGTHQKLFLFLDKYGKRSHFWGGLQQSAFFSKASWTEKLNQIQGQIRSSYQAEISDVLKKMPNLMTHITVRELCRVFDRMKEADRLMGYKLLFGLFVENERDRQCEHYHNLLRLLEPEHTMFMHTNTVLEGVRLLGADLGVHECDVFQPAPLAPPALQSNAKVARCDRTVRPDLDQLLLFPGNLRMKRFNLPTRLGVSVLSIGVSVLGLLASLDYARWLCLFRISPMLTLAAVGMPFLRLSVVLGIAMIVVGMLALVLVNVLRKDVTLLSDMFKASPTSISSDVSPATAAFSVM